MGTLKSYRKKRNLKGSPEPEADLPQAQHLRFVVQKHKATRLHYDLRLELDGVYKSWAVPKGFSMSPAETHLAILVEDHPLSYGSFEGVIPKGHYGAGTVLVWDRGTYTAIAGQDKEASVIALREGFKKGDLKFVLSGEKVQGAFVLVRTRKANEWLLIKKADAFSTYKDFAFDELSVVSRLDFAGVEAKNQAVIKNRPLLPIHAEDLATLKAKSEEELFPKALKAMIPLKFNPDFVGSKDWLFEDWPEGTHILVNLNRDRCEMRTKTGLAYKSSSSALYKQLLSLDCVAVFDAILLNEQTKQPKLFVFDILHWEAKSLRSLPLAKRKTVLSKILKKIPSVAFSKGESSWEAFAKTLTPKTASFIARHRKGLYKPGKTSATYYIVTVEKAADPSVDLATVLIQDKGETSFHPIPTAKVFKETRSDDTCVIEGGPVLTSLKKVLWPEDKITKGDLLDYYKKISSLIVPYLRDRPLSLNRYPHGIHKKSFYQKNMTEFHPKWFHTIAIASHSGDHAPAYPLCQNEESLLYLINLNCIEMHAQLTKVQHLEYPDQMVIDIDPSPELPWTKVIDVAAAFYEVFTKLKIQSYPKTSGGKGFHIFVPLVPERSFEDLRDFLLILFAKVGEQFPNLISVDKNPNKRKGKIYLDYLQNTRGQTMASVYSVRPKAGAPVSCPLAWHEVSHALRPEHFHLRNMMARLEKVGDLWHGMTENAYKLVSFQKRLEKL